VIITGEVLVSPKKLGGQGQGGILPLQDPDPVSPKIGAKSTSSWSWYGMSLIEIASQL
jgi:hypothetical protein